MELAKANVEKENIENELKYKNKSLIKVVSAVSTLLLSVAVLFEGNEKNSYAYYCCCDNIDFDLLCNT